jgi:hypothetical protein
MREEKVKSIDMNNKKNEKNTGSCADFDKKIPFIFHFRKLEISIGKFRQKYGNEKREK